MIVAAAWPGATVEETLSQVTERLERTLQETHQFDVVRSYTTAGQTTIFVDLDETTDTAGHPRRLVPRAPEHRRHARHAAAGRRRAVLQRRLRRHLRHHLRRSPPTASPSASCATTSRTRARSCCRCRTSPRSRCSARRTSGSSSSSRPRSSPGLRLDFATIVGTLQAQNVLRPAGVIQTERERVYLRVTGAFDNEQRHRERQHRRRRPHLSGSATSPRCGAASSTRRRRCSASTASRRSASRSRCATRATSSRSARTSRKTMADIKRGAAGRHRADAGRRPGGDRRPRDQRLPDVAVAGDHHHPRLQLREPRRAARHRRRAGDPADAGDRVRGHELHAHRPAARLARRADHRADAAGRRRDDDGRRDASGGSAPATPRTTRRRSPTVRWRRRC